MTICMVCGEYPPDMHGGIGTFTQNLARSLVRAGHHVRVVGLSSAHTVPRVDDDHGVAVLRLPFSTGPLRLFRSRQTLFRTIAEWARNGEIDLVEVPDFQGWAAHWPQLPVPVTVRLHGSATYFAAEIGQRTSRITTYCERQSIHRADVWCSTSHYTAAKTQRLFDLPTPAAAILYNGVEVGPAPSWESRVNGKIVFAGTLTKKKGVISLIDAWPRVAAAFPEAVLHVLGKDGDAPGGGSMQSYLRARLTDEAAARVQFAGHVPLDRVLREFRTAQIAVLPSFAEAFALVPLESMAAGCATIGSSLGSGPELIEHDVDGVTVDPTRADDVAAAMIRLLSNPSLARDLAARGYEKLASRFSHEATIGANLQFFEQCIAGYRAAAHRRPAPMTSPAPARESR